MVVRLRYEKKLSVVKERLELLEKAREEYENMESVHHVVNSVSEPVNNVIDSVMDKVNPVVTSLTNFSNTAKMGHSDSDCFSRQNRRVNSIQKLCKKDVIFFTSSFFFPKKFL